jgi:amino acid adenylation domain-containing protein
MPDPSGPVSNFSIPMRGTLSPQPLPSPDSDRICRLSYAQERLWLIHQRDGSSAGYNLPLGIRLRGALSAAALERALQEIVQRHEVLRTHLVVRNGEPFQQILPKPEFSLNTLDLSNVPKGRQEEEVHERMRAEAQQPFDLEKGPLFCARLLRLDTQDHVLLITMHHIVSDGWSIGVLLEELVTLYANFSQGRPSPLPNLPMQYADFAEWQREWLSGETLKQQMSYWEQQLSNLPSPLELPADRPQPANRSFTGDSYRFAISAEVVEKLRRLARESKASLFMVLLAAWQVLLYRYSSQSDILIGTAIANRNRLQLEKLIGFFVNILVLRTELSGNPSFAEVVQRARETGLAAQEHQDLPFEKLVAELDPQRHLSENPFFRVSFNWLNLPVSGMELAGLKWEHLEEKIAITRFDLMLTVFEGKAELPALLEYSTDLFDESTIARLGRNFLTLLDDIGANPQQKICALQVLSSEERRQLLVEWTRNETEYPRDSSVGQLFEQQADQSPENVALVFQNRKLTYSELNGKANQLAHFLLSNGVKVEDRIAVYMDSSAEMIIALLAIVKSGGAYVALDRTYPAERIAFIVNDTKARLLITQENLKENLPQGLPVKFLCMENEWREIEQASSSDLKLQLASSNLAYIAYTSGSTGTPKGVAIPHRGVIRLVRGNNYARFGPEETFLQFAPVAFDASTFEIWGCLLNGGKLVVAPAGAAGIEGLGAILRKEQVTTAWLTTGLFHWMADYHLDDLRETPQVLTGGEVLSKAHVMKFLGAAAEETVFANFYGPTEGTTFTSYHPIKKGAQFPASIPVGRPIANTQVYVLDARMQPVPIGAPGELFIGGDGLARGYWEQPDLTAEKFVPNPYSSKPGERLYRSGDRMRWLPDGTLEFLGRIDTQVKIRGYRVELGEIESCLITHPHIREAAVIAATQTSGEKYLVAYFSARVPTEVTGEELRQHLRTRLPDYMVPSMFVPVEEFPLTANGKIDRKALASLSPAEVPGKTHVPPRTCVEKVIAQIWNEVLARPDIGIEDNFFELGGHSLQATQIVLRLRDLFQVDDFPLRRLFESPTVAGLASALKEHYNPETLEAVAQAVLEAQNLLPEQIEGLLS